MRSEPECDDRCAIHAGALIENNVLFRNGHPEDGSGPYDAIRIVGIPEVVDGFVLKNNRVFHSGGHAIYAPGVTDGGRNRAVHSGSRPQCVGVDCKPRPRRVGWTRRRQR